jgi:CheY-like chemotaxis protein
MPHNFQPIVILMAEDDADDRMLVKEAFAESRIANNLLFVEDGVELLEYLHHQGKYQDANLYPDPHLILLDLNMPRKDGREALQEIKANLETRKIPVVILTTSTAEEDILRSYDIGAAGYIAKPVTFEAFVDVVHGLKEYWLQIVRLPSIDYKENRE